MGTRVIAVILLVAGVTASAVFTIGYVAVANHEQDTRQCQFLTDISAISLSRARTARSPAVAANEQRLYHDEQQLLVVYGCTR